MKSAEKPENLEVQVTQEQDWADHSDCQAAGVWDG